MGEVGSYSGEKGGEDGGSDKGGATGVRLAGVAVLNLADLCLRRMRRAGLI